MDRLDCNRNCDCFTGSGIADEFVAGFILEQYGNKDMSDQQIKAAIISDRQVSGYYYNAFEKQFVLRNIKTCLITVDEGEQHKNLSQVNNIIKELTEFGLNGNDWIIGFGGGAVLDLAGFAARIWLRPWLIAYKGRTFDSRPYWIYLTALIPLFYAAGGALLGSLLSLGVDLRLRRPLRVVCLVLGLGCLVPILTTAVQFMAQGDFQLIFPFVYRTMDGFLVWSKLLPSLGGFLLFLGFNYR